MLCILSSMHAVNSITEQLSSIHFVEKKTRLIKLEHSFWRAYGNEYNESSWTSQQTKVNTKEMISFEGPLLHYIRTQIWHACVEVLAFNLYILLKISTHPHTHYFLYCRMPTSSNDLVVLRTRILLDTVRVANWALTYTLSIHK